MTCCFHDALTLEHGPVRHIVNRGNFLRFSSISFSMVPHSRFVKRVKQMYASTNIVFEYKPHDCTPSIKPLIFAAALYAERRHCFPAVG